MAPANYVHGMHIGGSVHYSIFSMWLFPSITGTHYKSQSPLPCAQEFCSFCFPPSLRVRAFVYLVCSLCQGPSFTCCLLAFLISFIPGREVLKSPFSSKMGQWAELKWRCGTNSCPGQCSDAQTMTDVVKAVSIFNQNQQVPGYLWLEHSLTS